MDEQLSQRFDELEGKVRRLTRRVTNLERSSKKAPKLAGPQVGRM